MKGKMKYWTDIESINEICNYTWTTDNGFTFHHCPLSPGHDGAHHCWIEDCPETAENEHA